MIGLMTLGMNKTVERITIKSDDRMVAITNTTSDKQIEEINESGMDVIVKFHDGSKYIASFFLFKKLLSDMCTPRSISVNSLNYFWKKNMVVVPDFRTETVEEIINEMMAEGDFSEAFEKLN